MLAVDLLVYAPGHKLLVLTDKPEEYSIHKNVLPILHRQESLWRPYHDKRFAIEQASKRSNCVVFLDADTRIINNVPADFAETLPVGITAYFASPWLQWEQVHPNEAHKAAFIRSGAKELDVDLNDCWYIWEAAIAFKFDASTQHALREFLDVWANLAHHFQLQGWFEGEDHSMAVAAGKAGLVVGSRHFLGEGVVFNENPAYCEPLLSAGLEREVALHLQQQALIRQLSAKPLEDFLKKSFQAIRRRYRTRVPPRSWKGLA